MGGFVSAPGAIAGRLMGYPIIIHEQNAKVGLANKWLAKIATCVVTGFPNTFPIKVQAKTTGNPVRKEIAALAAPDQRFVNRAGPLRILVIGGSLGAGVLNQLIPLALANLVPSDRPDIWHQTGEKTFSETQKLYSDHNLRAFRLEPFIVDMALAYDWADIVICRAGALTLAELCVAGLGAIMVPYPYSIDDHQTANADFLVQNGAGIAIQQNTLNVALLTDHITHFTLHRAECLKMANAAFALRNTHSAEDIVTLCKENCL
jgi:UDP-N-acetylglucosamine--N-acetylmuramyl-(pentapeptide) pyrophosphoryl-undecaprenol N-acetylglucosamine transferase